MLQRPEPRRRVGRFVAGLLSGVGRRNGWQLAEHPGEATPDGMQRLLYQAKWDADAVCARVVDYVGEHLGTPEGVRHAVVNCQVGVVACYVSGRGMALVDRELYLPAVWTTDRERCQAAGVPEQVGFATKPQLAVGMLARLLGRLPAAWVAADAVYGPDTWPRRRVGRFVAGLLSGVGRRNGWQLAEHPGETTPDGMQRLLYQAKWDADAVCARVVDAAGLAGGPRGVSDRRRGPVCAAPPVRCAASPAR